MAGSEELAVDGGIVRLELEVEGSILGVGLSLDGSGGSESGNDAGQGERFHDEE